MLPIHKYKQGRASIYLTQSYHKHRTQGEHPLGSRAVALHAPILFYKSKFKTATESDAHSLSLLSCDVCLNKSIFKIRIWNWNLSFSNSKSQANKNVFLSKIQIRIFASDFAAAAVA